MKTEWTLYDWVDHRGNNAIKLWMHGLEKKQLAKLNNKLDLLEEHGPDLPAGLLSDTESTDIKKIRIKGNVAIRLFLCYGPIDKGSEFTLLYLAKEKDKKLIPIDALNKAKENRQRVIDSPLRRRCNHEKISPTERLQR